MKKNITFTNSKWTKKIIKLKHGIESIVVYPPVFNDFPKNPWKNREDGIVCIGRISPSKEYEKIIKIVKSVRSMGWNLHLHIIGLEGDFKYAQKIKKLARENSSWVFLEGKVSRYELTNIILKHKFGIHGYKCEHFGIVIAEMVKGGCIVFVPNDGGQTEIIGTSQLIYDNISQASQKIVKVLKNPKLQNKLRTYLCKRVKQFSKDNFIKEIRKHVRDVLK